MLSLVSPAFVRWLAVPLVVLALGGCSAPPQELIAEAQEAAENAKTARVELYAPELAQKAETALQEAETEIAVQDEKFVVLRNYKVATAKLTEAMEAFAQATTEATKQKGQMKAPVRALVKEATMMVDAVEQGVAKLTRRLPPAEVVPLQDQVAVMRQTLADAAVAEKAADYPKAKSMLEQVLAEATKLRTRLDPNWATESPPMATPPPADPTAPADSTPKDTTATKPTEPPPAAADSTAKPG